MSKFRIFLIVLVALILLILPLSAAGAQGPYYYCSAARTSGGSGTYYDPWACSTDAQRQAVIDTVCRLGGGTVYQIFTGEYVVIYVSWNGQQCVATVGQRYPGYPPNTGVDLPAPLIFGGVALLGIALVGGGLLLRRNRQAA